MSAHARPLTKAEHAAQVAALTSATAKGIAEAQQDHAYRLAPDTWEAIGNLVLAALVADLGEPEG